MQILFILLKGDLNTLLYNTTDLCYNMYLSTSLLKGNDVGIQCAPIRLICSAFGATIVIRNYILYSVKVLR